MPQFSNNSDSKLSHFICTAAGLVAGSWLVRTQIEDQKKSRAERDDPDQAEEVYDEIDQLLDEWKPDADCENEDDYTRDLVEFLEENSDWEIELYRDSNEGTPDILVGNLLALELKLDPSKTELDRAVGQCAGYSREWITCMVVVDGRSDRMDRLRTLLCDKGLEQIEVWDFA